MRSSAIMKRTSPVHGFTLVELLVVIAIVGTLVGLLVLITFIGEAVREAFDPKKFTTYR